jgi:REP element-mobilizing transposase RayT
MNRGDRREEIARDDEDRGRFLSTLAEACAKTGWQIHAFCVMSNHFHIVVETPRPNLAIGMQWLLGTYTQRFNARHGLRGHLFGGRYKALVVDGREPGYLRTVCDYVHLNPARAVLVGANQPLESFPWSSYGDYLKPPGKRPCWLRADRVLGEHGIQADTPRGRRAFARRVEAVRLEGLGNDQLNAIRRGWKLGAEDFVDWLIERVEMKPAEAHPATQRDETEEQKAERIIAQELERLDWSEAELTARRKGDPGKVSIARRLREETAVTLKWVAGRLHMGAWTHVSHQLYHHGRHRTVNT